MNFTVTIADVDAKQVAYLNDQANKGLPDKPLTLDQFVQKTIDERVADLIASAKGRVDRDRQQRFALATQPQQDQIDAILGTEKPTK